MQSGFFDSHAHYEDGRFESDRIELLGSMPGRGVFAIINVGSCIRTSKASVCLAETFPFVYAAVGVHPHEADSFGEESLHYLKRMCAHEKVVAIGEIGLDFHYDFSPRETQRIVFKRQLELAKDLNAPVIVHSREATAEALAVLNESGVKRGVIHCFNGSLDIARRYIEMGYFIGIGGAVTFDNSKKLREAVREIPAEKILIETDAPYQTPAPRRGARNDSSLLGFTVGAIAAIKDVPAGYIADCARENALRFIGRETV